MRLETRQECIGSSPRVSRVCQDDTREFARRRPRLAGRLSRVAEKLVGRIRKLARNMSGDCQKKTIGLAARMPEATRFAGRINRPYLGVRATKPPRSAGKPPVPYFFGYV
ncbi:hypothetical protein BHM03_00039404 [Ensete ventricosum]|nr:hypothetical protein BHM03_00039404 [Ensete ventricosum]